MYSLSWIHRPHTPRKHPPSKTDIVRMGAAERSLTRSSTDSGSSLGWEPATPRSLQYRGSPSHAHNNLRQLHDLRASRPSSAPDSPRLSPRPNARAAPLDAPLVSASYVPPGMLDMNGAMAAVCASWAAGAGLTSVGSVVSNLGNNAEALPCVLFAGGAFNLLCSLIDTGLTIHAWREAKKQYQVFESLLGAQHLMLHELKDQLRHGADPQLQAARDLAQFNVDVLSSLLKGFEKAYLLPAERPLASERRQLQLDHLVTADEALRLRQQALAYPDERRQGLADDAERRRDALQARIEAFDATSQVPLFERMREGLSHPLDLLGNLSDEQIAFLRDGVLQGAKVPLQFFNALAALLPHLVSSGAAGAALDTVGQVVPPLAVLLTMLNLVTAHWDQQGGQNRMRKARAGRDAKLRAFERVVRGFAPDSVDPHATPEQVQQTQRVRRNLARQLTKAVERANRAKCAALARKFRGKFNLANFLLSLAGVIAMAAGTGSYGTIPAAAVSAVLGLWLLTQLAKYQGYLAADKQRMHRRHREAEAFGDPNGVKTGQLYAGRLDGDASMTDTQRLALQDNTYLSLGWLRGQLYEVGLQASRALGSEPPLCDAEQALLDAGVPRETLHALRQAALVRTPAQHGRLVDAMATGVLGLRLFPADRRAPPDGVADGDHALPPVLRTRAAQALTSFASLADLDLAIKGAGKSQLRRRNKRPGRIARGFWFKPLATPKKMVRALDRHATRGDAPALNQLRRDVLQPLLNSLPLRPDGLGIAWPAHYRGTGEDDPDTADCLIRYLRELQDTCRLGQLALADGQQKERWSDRWMRRRLHDYAELAEALVAAVQQERHQAEPWWDELIDSHPVFRQADDAAERIDPWSSGHEGDEALSEMDFPSDTSEASEASFREDAPEQAAGPLPAYAIKV